MEGQRRQLNGRWVVEGRCCCWLGCCWTESHNFGWSWGVEGGGDGGDGVGWWSLIGGLDRPSKTVSPDKRRGSIRARTVCDIPDSLIEI